MDKYFRLKMVIEFMIPMILVTLIVGITLVKLVVRCIKDIRIEKFFISHGYERELLDVSSCGNGSYYGWVRSSDNTYVDDRKIRGWSLKRIKETYK